MARYYDCHTYNRIPSRDTVSIINGTAAHLPARDGYYSVGIHPWHVENTTTFEKDWMRITEMATHPKVIAIGECGLDKLQNKHFALQRKVFEYHIGLANRLRKPLIIHCVKAFGETAELLKTAQVPILIHGINNKTARIKSFLEAGYHLSFGKALLKEHSIARETILQIPLDQLLLETDDCTQPISQIYKTASDLRSIAVESLILQVQKNFNRIFSL